MDVAIPGHSISLTWINVSLGLGFIFFDSFLSVVLHLDLCGWILTAAFRCVAQLVIMGAFLQSVFRINDPWAIGAIAFVLNFLGTLEAVANRSKKRFDYMFLSVLMALLGSTIPVSIIGVRYAMAINPYWIPEQFIPIVGMLCGNAVSGLVVTVAYILQEIHDNRDKIETYLAFGASRFEACLPIAREALRLALTPIVNQMSVIGVISIPGMMTGAILGGTSVEQATKLQMIIIFMISASTTLATIITTTVMLSIVVDHEHRVRPDRVDVQEHIIWRTISCILTYIVSQVKRLPWPCHGQRKDHMGTGPHVGDENCITYYTPQTSPTRPHFHTIMRYLNPEDAYRTVKVEREREPSKPERHV